MKSWLLVAGARGTEQERYHGDQVVRETSTSGWESAGGGHDIAWKWADVGWSQTTTRFAHAYCAIPIWPHFLFSSSVLVTNA